MKKRLLKMRLLHSEIEGMCDAYTMINASYDPENEHERLLLEMATNMLTRLTRMARKQQEHYTLALNMTEALSFNQYWQSVRAWPMPIRSTNAIRKVLGILKDRAGDGIL